MDPMAKEKAKNIALGVVIGLLPAVGAAWTFATTAAEHVMAPHLSAAKARVHVMCALARVQNDNIQEICKATGAACKDVDPSLLLSGCEEPQ